MPYRHEEADLSQSTPLPAAAAPGRASTFPWAVYLELAKARLCALVLVTTTVGFILASSTTLNWPLLLATLLGTAAAAFGANAFNQYLEADRDARMRRTAGRPLPTGRLTPWQARTFALTMTITGPVLLALLAKPLAAVLALLTALIYVLGYTPLKVRTPLNTLVGAVVGAIPPMIGWAAATGRLDFGAWLLGAILFFWQIPHFLALAWLYREDYARGGFRMLPVVDHDGGLTGRIVVLYSLILLPLGLSITLAGLAGLWYAAGAALLGLGLLAAGVRLYRQRQAADARRVFLASVIYLPLLPGLMVADRRAPAAAPAPAAPPTVAVLAG
jgi:protoheme IX farnesyltransferase